MSASSVLEGFFRAGSAAEVRRATRELAAASQGEVTAEELPRDPTRARSADDGLFSPTIFGSLEETERLGHVVVPGGVLHPVLAPEIARVLGISREEVMAVARFEAELDGGRVVARPRHREEEDDDDALELSDDLEPSRSGTEALARALGRHAHLLVDRVPVPPLAHRPYASSAAPHVLLPVPGPINEAYASLVGHARRVARLRELGAPPLSIACAEIRAHARFDRVYRAVRREAPAREETRPPAPRYDLRFPASPSLSDDAATEVALLFLDEDRLLVQHGSLVELGAEGSRALDAACAGHRARHVDPSGRWVFFTEARCGHAGDGLVIGAAILDVATGVWLETPPDALPIVVLGGGVISDLRTSMGGEGPIVSDEAGVAVPSRDGRFAWSWEGQDRGPIVALATGDRCLETGPLLRDRRPPFVLEDGRLVDTDPGEPDEEDAPVAAIAFTPDHAFRLALDSGVVIEVTRAGTTTLCTLGFRPLTVAWSPSGRRLAALADASRVLLVDLVERGVTTTLRSFASS